jgi:hypothetical protein
LHGCRLVDRPRSPVPVELGSTVPARAPELCAQNGAVRLAARPRPRQRIRRRPASPARRALPAAGRRRTRP